MRSGHDSFSRRGNSYYDDLFSEITNLAFGHRVFGAGLALIGRDRTLTKHVAQSFDPSQYQLDPGAWTHEHCNVCNYCIDPGHTYWENEDGDCLCDVCYEAYVGGNV